LRSAFVKRRRQNTALDRKSCKQSASANSPAMMGCEIQQTVSERISMRLPLVRRLRVGHFYCWDIYCDVALGRSKIQCSLGNSRRLGLIRNADLLAFYKKLTMSVI